MDTKSKQNIFSNPVVIVLVLALVGLGGYMLFSKNSNNNSVENQITQKQKECAALFNAFKLKVLDDASTQQTVSKNYFSISDSDFVVGYSPRLDNCVGGYTLKLLSSGSGTATVSYVIVDPKTDLMIKNWPEYNSIMMTYANYRKTLDDITNGQISVNDIDPKEDNTPGLMFCNVSYFKCSIGDRPMCNSNNPSSTGWCASQ